MFAKLWSWLFPPPREEVLNVIKAIQNLRLAVDGSTTWVGNKDLSVWPCGTTAVFVNCERVDISTSWTWREKLAVRRALRKRISEVKDYTHDKERLDQTMA